MLRVILLESEWFDVLIHILSLNNLVNLASSRAPVDCGVGSCQRATNVLCSLLCTSVTSMYDVDELFGNRSQGVNSVIAIDTGTGPGTDSCRAECVIALSF